MNVDSDERRVVTWAEVGLVVPFVGQGRGYVSWCEQVWRGITLAALACIPEGGASSEPPPRLHRSWFSFVRIRKQAFFCVQKKTPLTSFVSGVRLRRGWDSNPRYP